MLQKQETDAKNKDLTDLARATHAHQKTNATLTLVKTSQDSLMTGEGCTLPTYIVYVDTILP